jgi:hypothetical protein
VLIRIFAIAAIFCCTSIGWLVLAASLWSRSSKSDQQLKPNVASTWGTEQEQRQPFVTIEQSDRSRDQATSKVIRIVPDRTRAAVNLRLDYRQKGLLWYSVYVVDFNGAYRFTNPAATPQSLIFNFPFPSKQAIYDDLTIAINGQAQPFTSDQQGAAVSARVAPGETAVFRVSYRSNGLESWRYNFGSDVTQTHDFELVLHTNFRDIDFPMNTLSPTEKLKEKSGWQLVWRYHNLISGFHIGLTMPERLQPGPLVGQISEFAPVSLLLFFFVLFVITTVGNVSLHPMNYFFLAAAFFAFHLLLAYSVDHISVQLAFLFSSAVSLFLTASYLRLVMNSRIALLETLAAQMVYLVLFSYTFFLKGFTGLAITIGCIITLFVAMQATGRVRWNERFGSSIPGRAWNPGSVS